MTAQDIGALALYAVAVIFNCICVPAGMVWFVLWLRRFMIGRTYTPVSLKPPSEFKARCPMCGSRKLEEGIHVGNEAYVPNSEKERVRYVNRHNNSLKAWSGGRLYGRRSVLRCMNCGYVMTFFPPE